MFEPKYGDVSVALDCNVATLEIHRPPHNFFDFNLIRDLANAFEALDNEPECRALMLCSEGKSFCAGANFANRDAQSGEAPARTGENPLYVEGVRLFRCKKPVVAAIQGAAIGGGLGLALVADFRVATVEARFAANFVKIGIHPGFGLTYTLPRLIGAQKASLMFFTGRRIEGKEALAMGPVRRNRGAGRSSRFRAHPRGGNRRSRPARTAIDARHDAPRPRRRRQSADRSRVQGTVLAIQNRRPSRRRKSSRRTPPRQIPLQVVIAAARGRGGGALSPNLGAKCRPRHFAIFFSFFTGCRGHPCRPPRRRLFSCLDAAYAASAFAPFSFFNSGITSAANSRRLFSASSIGMPA